MLTLAGSQACWCLRPNWMPNWEFFLVFEFLLKSQTSQISATQRGWQWCTVVSDEQDKNCKKVSPLQSYVSGDISWRHIWFDPLFFLSLLTARLVAHVFSPARAPERCVRPKAHCSTSLTTFLTICPHTRNSIDRCDCSVICDTWCLLFAPPTPHFRQQSPRRK